MQDHGQQHAGADVATAESIPHPQQNGVLHARSNGSAGAMGAPDDGPFGGTLGMVRSAVLHELSHEERLLVILWHAERMTPAEIGAVLDTTAERVLQMYDAVVGRLRTVVSKAA